MNYPHNLVTLMVLVIMGGCAVPVHSPATHSHTTSKSDTGLSYNYDGTLNTRPCKPFNADALMNWAKALPIKQHHRSADVTVRNDRIECNSRESAESRQGQ